MVALKLSRVLEAIGPIPLPCPNPLSRFRKTTNSSSFSSSSSTAATTTTTTSSSSSSSPPRYRHRHPKRDPIHSLILLCCSLIPSGPTSASPPPTPPHPPHPPPQQSHAVNPRRSFPPSEKTTRPPRIPLRRPIDTTADPQQSLSPCRRKRQPR